MLSNTIRKHFSAMSWLVDDLAFCGPVQAAVVSSCGLYPSLFCHVVKFFLISSSLLRSCDLIVYTEPIPVPYGIIGSIQKFDLHRKVSQDLQVTGYISRYLVTIQQKVTSTNSNKTDKQK